MINVEESIRDYPLRGLLEVNQLSKTGLRDLNDLMAICLDAKVAPG